MSCAVVWLRRDLRVDDHPALTAACRSADTVAVVFCFDDRLLRGRHASGSRTQFMLECLADLDMSLRRRGGGLIVRRGEPVREVVEVAVACRATEVHFTADVSPYAWSRDQRLAAACTAAGIRTVAHPGLAVVDSAADLRTAAGAPYRVFGPFHRAWLAVPRRPALAAPRRVPRPDGAVEAGRLPSLGGLGQRQVVSSPLPGGEQAGRRRLAQLAGRADGRENDTLGIAATSRLSPYLRFGAISPLRVEAVCPSEAFRRQLCWRDFYLHVLHHHPDNLRHEFQPRYRSLGWRRSAGDLERWQQGRTGYPLVDAAMRQLRAEGWIPNRGRLVVGSFLTKHLGIDWRAGEAWFMHHLLDGDPAQNNGNWQWIASVGTDPQPVTRRLLNPVLQQRRFDPDGVYVRLWVPELRDVPDAYLCEPWRLPDDLQDLCGCVIGVDYPEPMVDHRLARTAALERYRSAWRAGAGEP